MAARWSSASQTVVPAGQNVRMDVQFLERAFKRCQIPYPFDYHVIDLATLFYSWSLVSGEPVAALSLRQAAVTAGLIDGVVMLLPAVVLLVEAET